MPKSTHRCTEGGGGPRLRVPRQRQAQETLKAGHSGRIMLRTPSDVPCRSNSHALGSNFSPCLLLNCLLLHAPSSFPRWPCHDLAFMSQPTCHLSPEAHVPHPSLYSFGVCCLPTVLFLALFFFLSLTLFLCTFFACLYHKSLTREGAIFGLHARELSAKLVHHDSVITLRILILALPAIKLHFQLFSSKKDP